MKIYIAGKITGDPEYKTKFREAEEALAREGHTVLNPAALPEGLSRAEYMQICFQMIFAADKVVLLPDSSNSDGAMLEYHLCRYIGKPTATYLEMTGMERRDFSWMKEN